MRGAGRAVEGLEGLGDLVVLWEADWGGLGAVGELTAEYGHWVGCWRLGLVFSRVSSDV